MRSRNKLIALTALSVALTMGSGCKKFLDVNKNPNDATPASVSLSLVLSAAERNIGNSFALGNGLANTMSVYVHQQTGRTGADNYGAGESGWNGLYSAISNLNVIITRGTGESRFVYSGVAKILKAYTMSMMVDIWGDIPYSEYDKFPEIKQPKFDKGEDIYPQLITLLDEGIADINNPAPNATVPGADDYIYRGNKANWIKAANTIKLKMYTQVRLVQNVTAEVTALLASPATLISSQAESFMLPYGNANGATDDRHPAYGDYTATQRGGQLPSPWLYEILKGWNPNILTGLADPRIPYYIYNQKAGVGGPNATTANTTPENCTDYRDGGFVTIIFGSKGPCRDGSNSNTYSLFGVFPAGGRFNDSLAVTVNSYTALRAATGSRPHEFITYADRLFLEAELIQTGVITGDARTAFSAALDASFRHVDAIVAAVAPGSAGAAQVVPTIATLPATTTYKTGVLSAYDAGSDAKKLEYIITEKWINRIENPIDNYTDYRRTGYPVLFSPAPIGNVSQVQPPNGPAVAVLNDRLYPVSLPFSLTEIQLNSNAPPQKIPETYKVFWQP